MNVSAPRIHVFLLKPLSLVTIFCCIVHCQLRFVCIGTVCITHISVRSFRACQFKLIISTLPLFLRSHANNVLC